MEFNSGFKGLIFVIYFSMLFVNHYLASTYGIICGAGSVVGIATGYGLDSPGIVSRWGRDFPHLSRPDINFIKMIKATAV